MDSLFMEQHFLRSSLRLYPGGGNDPMDSENNNGSLFSAAMMEKARAHLQLWGRYSPGDIHAMLLSGAAQHVYPRAVPSWGQPGGASPWGQPGLPGLPPGLLGPPPVPSHHRPQITPPPSTTPSSGSPSPTSPTSAADLRLPKMYSSHRFSPYSQGGGAPSRQLSPNTASPRQH